jgi:hypothetical protein
VVIRLALEAAPCIEVDCLDEHEAQRLDDWINHDHRYLALISEAHRLGEQDRAA